MEGLLEAELWVKLALAIGCGAAVGLERELSDKPAGLRTTMLICIGSTLITMVSLHIAIAFSEAQIVIGDPGRIAGEMISGIGFLGAGAIIQARGSVHGLTTAATIWFMAGIGLAIGSGAYAWALVTTFLVLVILYVLGRLETRMKRPRRFVQFKVESRRDPRLLDELNQLAESAGLSLDDFKLARHDEGMEMEFALTCTREARDELIGRMLEIDGVRDVRVNG